MATFLDGAGTASGIGMGTAFIYVPTAYAPSEAYIEPEAAEAELKAWHCAKAKAEAELTALAASGADPDQQGIMAAQCEILNDEEAEEMICEAISSSHAAASWAVQSCFDEFIALLSRSANERIVQRTTDLRDVRDRLLRILGSGKEVSLSSLAEDTVVVTHDLFPSDTAGLDKEHTAAIVTQLGGLTSHCAILAKSYGIPAVLGVSNALETIRSGDRLIVDSGAGRVILSPSADEWARYAEEQAQVSRLRSEADAAAALPCQMKSGEPIAAGINIASVKALDGLERCDFVGLFRTEFLYMDADHLPTEEEQFLAYKAVLQAAAGKTVTLRTLDIGGDKQLKYRELPHEANPFLGKRALRLCFDEPDLFRTQLRAACRASAFGAMQIMFPMVGSVEDWRRARDFTRQVMTELEAEGIAYDPKLKLGVMIEIPSLAIISDVISHEVDFASIGTNDLCQYLCAADRMEPSVRAYYQSFSPAFLRTLRRILAAFQDAGKEISMCGELAGDPKASALLAGLGLRKFSMSAVSLGPVKQALRESTLETCQALADKALHAATQAEVLELLKK